jgi:predicted permease
MRINEVVVTIVGINRPGFTGLTPGRRPDVFMPLKTQAAVLPWRWGRTSSLIDDPDYWWVLVMGRLADGADERTAQAVLDVALGDAVQPLLAARPGTDRPRLRLTPGGGGVDDLRHEFSRPLLVLVAFVGLVLLIACANLANLLLARAAARQREISMRLALGAGPRRIARQVLTEGLVLAGLGGAAGVLLGFWLRDGIPHLLASSWSPGRLSAEFNWRVLVLSSVVTLVTGVLFSLVPMWQVLHVRVSAALKDGSHSTMGRSRRLARRSLIVLQVALSVVLLIGAGLFVRTLWNLRSADLGFQPRRIVLFTIDPPRALYTGGQRTALFSSLEEAVANLPGVQSASLSSEALVSGSSSITRVTPRGRASRGQRDRAWVNDVGAAFFDTMGIPILHGRGLGPQDRAGAVRVAVVNQQFVRTFFPGQDPIGQTFSHGDQVCEIVGIAADARYDRINQPMPPTFYRPFAQAEDLGSMTFEVRTTLETAALLEMVRGAVRSIDKDVPVFDVRTQLEQIDATLSQQRLFAALTSAFGLLALLLASVGIYGVIAGSVASRIGEIGVRMALGAGRRQVLSMILRETVSLAGAGVIAGVAAAAAAARYVASFLYDVRPFDPITALTAVLLMLAVALLAGWWPASLASRLDPMQALRHE